MEMIDVFDVNGNPTGAVKGRKEPLAPGEYRLAVGIWVTDGEGNLFVTRRAKEKSFAPGKWENTAGHVRAGEDPEDAVVRELFEETGISVRREDVRFLGKAEPHWPYIGLNYGVTAQFDAKDVRLQPGETDDAKWVTLDELWEMRDTESFAPSVFEHMNGYLDAFLDWLKAGK